MAESSKLRVAGKAAAGTLAFWYLSALGMFFKQETTVGWPKMQRNLTYLVYAASMLTSGTLTAIPGLVAHMLLGKKQGRKVAWNVAKVTVGFFSKSIWGDFEVEGAENLPPGDEGCLYVCNHTSGIDFAAVYHLPNGVHLTAVAKSAIKFLPGMGLAHGLAGGIWVSRSGGGLEAMIKESANRLDDGISVLIYPQGTRKVPSPGVPPLPFRKGTFVLADRTKRRIVPMTICYGSDFMTSRRTLKSPRLVIHPIVEPAGDGDVEGLCKKVEAMVLAPLLAEVGST